MKKLFGVLVCLLLFVNLGFADPPTECVDPIYISSLPYTISSSNQCYVVTDNLSTSGTAISFGSGVSNVYLDLGGYTITWGTGGGSNLYGIYVPSATDIHIRNGTIYHGSSAGNSNVGIYSGLGIGWVVDTTNITIDGTDAHCVYMGPSVHNMQEFRGGTWTSLSTGSSDRHSYTGAVAKFQGGSGAGEFDFHVVGVTISNGPAQGMTFAASRVWVDSCHITLDQINELAPDQNANQYGIIITGADPGSRIIGDTIISGTSRGGCRGVFIENSPGTAEDPIWVRDNYINVACGPGEESDAYGTARGLRLRTLGLLGTTTSYVYCVNNTVITTADDDDSTTWIGRYAVSWHGLAYQNSSQGQGHHIRCDSNIFIGKLKGTSSSIAHAWAGCFYTFNTGGSPDPATTDTTGSSFRWNTLKSNNVIMGIRFSPGNEPQGCRGIVFRDNTLEFLDPGDSLYDDPNKETMVTGGPIPDYQCVGNEVVDFNYLNEAIDSVVNPAEGYTRIFNLTYRETAGIYVKDTAGNPIENATVKLYNDAEDLVWSDVSDAAGYISNLATYKFDSVGTVVDTNYNDFTFHVFNEAGTDSATLVVTLGPSYEDTVIVLGETQGSSDINPVSVSGKVIIKGKRNW